MQLTRIESSSPERTASSFLDGTTMASNDNCADDHPYANEFFNAISVTELVLIVLAGVLTLVTIGIFIETALYLMKHHIASKSVKIKSIIILGLYPTINVFSFCAICIPKAYLVSRLCASVYIAATIYTFLSLVFKYLGGRETFISTVEGQSFNICCCFCERTASRKTVTAEHILITQHAIIQLVVSYLSLVLWTNGNYSIGDGGFDNAAVYLDIIKVLSTVPCMNAAQQIVRISKKVGEPMHIEEKSNVLFIVVLLYNLQDSVFHFLALNDIPDCTTELSSGVRGRLWCNLLIILEMFLLAVLARIVYHRPDYVNPQYFEKNLLRVSDKPNTLTVTNIDRGFDIFADDYQRRQAIDKQDKNYGSLSV